MITFIMITKQMAFIQKYPRNTKSVIESIILLLQISLLLTTLHFVITMITFCVQD